MENLTIEHIVSFVEMHRYAGYFILFLVMILEGETFLIIAGMLASLNAFDIGDVFLIALSGVILGNMAWYYAGVKLSSRSFAKGAISRAEKAVDYFLPRFKEKPFKSILLSKFIYGVNHATVLMSGVLRVDLFVFLKAEFVASLLWVLLYVVLGYFFGYAAIHMTRNLSLFALFVVISMIGFVGLRKFIIYRYERREHQKLKESSNS